MPRDVTITFADGSSHVYRGAPDDLTPEQATARAQQEFGKQVTSLDGGRPKGFTGHAMEAGKSILRGAGQMLSTGISAMEALGSMEVQHPPLERIDRPLNPRFGENLGKFVTKVLPEPQDTGGARYLRKGLEGLGGGLVLPGGASLAGALSNIGGGVGAEAAATTVGEGPAQRFLGGLVGGILPGAALARLRGARPQVETVAREAMEGITEGQLKKASELQKTALGQGVRLDLAQALEGIGVPASNLTTIRNTIAGNKAGNQTQELLRTQPTEIDLATRVQTGKIPGTAYDTQRAATNIQETATGRIADEAKARTEAVRADYAAAGILPKESQQAVLAELQAKLKQPGLTDEARAVVTELLGKFSNAPPVVDGTAAREALAAATKPSQRAAAQVELARANATQGAIQPIHALDADVALSDALGAFKGSPTYQSNPRAAGQVKGIAGEINELLKQGSPTIAQAEQKFADISAATVNPLKQGPVGQFATPRGYLPDRSATQGKLISFFDAGSNPDAKVSQIKVLGNELGKRDPSAFQDGFKSWLTDKVNKISAPILDTAQAQPEVLASQLHNNLIGNASRWQGIKDAVSVIAKQNGQDPVEVIRGLENFGRILKAASSRPGNIRGMSPEQLQEMAGSNITSSALRMFSIAPLAGPAGYMFNREANKTFRTFDDLLTSPEGAATLAKLGKTPVMSRQAQALLNAFSTGVQQAGEGNRMLELQNTPGITP